MTKIIKDIGYWVAAPYGDGWTTFARENDDGTRTIWNELAANYCPLDTNGAMLSSVFPFYIRVDRSGTVLNCYEDIWKLVPHECRVFAVDAMIEAGVRYIDGEFLPPLPTSIFLSAEELFFGRMTDDEYDALNESVRTGESARIYRGWAVVASFTEGTDMWVLLVKHLDLTVTPTRRDELLARPVEAASPFEGAAA